jgi:hypothetical protein
MRFGGTEHAEAGRFGFRCAAWTRRGAASFDGFMVRGGDSGCRATKKQPVQRRDKSSAIGGRLAGNLIGASSGPGTGVAARRRRQHHQGCPSGVNAAPLHDLQRVNIARAFVDHYDVRRLVGTFAGHDGRDAAIFGG